MGSFQLKIEVLLSLGFQETQVIQKSQEFKIIFFKYIQKFQKSDYILYQSTLSVYTMWE